ncbi:hypothetical protein QEH52_13925 [Coraliomargarita sp. SDUM461003]|uniref:DM13 domain-containing protein n=1 Tax=Thalassobacterium maritimum TaxID=3041265 RepID=A0ABU1AWT7_9BACT|nr:hypothetical protein [Coraliomargarita sp. SDUM461003]MDQ8208619.1 hypothetical protein [Coraliomargarita sp. SDUM461003]
MKKKGNPQFRALVKTMVFFVLLIGGCTFAWFWVSTSEDSDWAQKIRRTIGIPAPQSSKVAELAPQPRPASSVVVETPPEPMVIDEPEALPEITFEEIAAQRHLWPDSLNLKSTVKVPIRYNGKDYGFMEFPEGQPIQVDEVMPSGEIFCLIQGNHLSLSVNETDFYAWFDEKYGDRYDAQSVVVDWGTRATSRFRLGTPEGDAAFWAEMRIWCKHNYGSVSLEVEEDTHDFAWLATYYVKEV